MNEFISAAQNQTTGHSRNIILSDGTYAYINSQGIAKKFNNMADYTATMGKNGCPGEAEPVTRTWENVQYRVGAPMMAGQSCGNESALVAAKLGPIDREFDKAYYESTSKKTFDTIEAATANWESSGRLAGIAPFNGATSFQHLSKMGYVDVDSVFHEITPTFSTTYKDKMPSYVTGTDMKTCLPSENVNFRDKVYIKTGDSFLYADGRSVKVYTGSLPLPASCEFYIQVPITSVTEAGSIPNTLYNQAIAYGDKCLLSTRNSWGTDDCKFWGCYTGKIYNNTFSLSDSALSTNLKLVSATGIAANTTIQFGEQFTIIGEVYKNVLRQGDTLTKITSGNYELTFSNRQLFIMNTQTGSKEVLKDNIDASAVTARWLGSVMYFISSTGEPLASYMYMSSGCSDEKCSLVLTDTGLLKVVSSSGTVLKKSNDTIPDSTEGSSVATNTTSGTPIEMYATIVNGEVAFTEAIADRATFSLVSTRPETRSCDVSLLQTKCNDTTNCIGFIHSTSENTWQPIKSTDTDSKYKISEVNSDLYLRYTSGSLTGSYCPSDTAARQLDRRVLSNYPKGAAVTSAAANCTARPRLIVPAFETYLKSIDDALKTVPEKPVGVDELKKFPEEVAPLLSKYESTYSSWLNMHSKPNALGNTLQQRLTDTHELDQHYRAMAILWGVITMAMIAIILFRPRN